MFFDKNKIIKYFNLSEEYENYEKYVSQQFREQNFGPFNVFVKNTNSKIDRQIMIDQIRNYRLSHFYRTYIKPNISSLKFNEIIKLIIKSDQMFSTSECDNKQYFDVLQSIYGNQFGMCFTMNERKYLDEF